MSAEELEPGRPRQRRQDIPRWAATILAGPLIVYALIQVDWSFLPSSAGELEVNAEFLVEELVLSFKLTLLAIVSLAVCRCLFPHRRQGGWVAVLLPLYLWGLEAAQLERSLYDSCGPWTPRFSLHILWLVPTATLVALALVLFSGMLQSVVGEPDAAGRGKRWVVNIGLLPALSAGIVVATILLDLLLMAVVIGELLARQLPS